MTKAEFLNSDQIPQFIKDIIKDAPDDVDISMDVCAIPVDALKGIRKERKKEDNADGINIAPYIEALNTQLNEIADMADEKGRVKVEDADTVMSLIDLMNSSLDCFDDYVAKERNKRNKKQ